MMHCSILVLSALLINCSLGSLLNGLTILTTEGPVRGALSASGKTRQFLGIPFAASTAPPFRWTPPRPPPLHLTEVLQAIEFGDSCPQSLNPTNLALFNITGIPIPPKQSENCLSLNIWSPSVERRVQNGKNTAVLIWVYGGSFTTGSSNIPWYVGQNFVENNDDITVVTINYRVNIFGTPTAPQLFAPGVAQNFGVLDIDAAIQWVHKNIVAFGGDPERITIFGESAGAVAVDAYAYSHPNDTIVKGIICESGTVSAGFPGGDPADPTASTGSWNVVAAAVGCGTVNDTAQLECMTSQSVEVLETVIAASDNISFSAIDDGVTIFADSRNRSIAGDFLCVPLLTGSNANEGDLFVLIQDVATGTAPGPTFFPTSDLVTNVTFLCTASIQSADRAKRVPTFRYRYEASFPDISQTEFLRSYHASEIPIVFGTYNSSNSIKGPGEAVPPPTAAEIALSEYVQSAWVAFARDPAAGLTGEQFNWPLYDPSGVTLVELGGSNNPTGPSFVDPNVFDLICPFLGVV